MKPSRGNAHAVMTSFNRAGCLWTSASSALCETILREEWGFDGYIITDMASSNAALYMTYQDAYMNGTDLFLGAGSETALDAYKTNAAFANKLRTSVHRILYAVTNDSAAMNGVSSNLRIEVITPWWSVALTAATCVAGVLFLFSAVMLTLTFRKKRTDKI